MDFLDTADWKALVTGMRAAPDDDLPRLVAADFLEEQGAGEWAAFVRSYVWERAAGATYLSDTDPGRFEPPHYWVCYPDPATPDDWPGVDRAEATRRVLDATVPRLPDRGRVVVRRGFVAEAEVTAAAWLAHGDAVYARQPVTAVRLTTHVRFDDGYPSDYGGDLIPVVTADGREWPDRRSAAVGWLSARWPGVAFTLPPAFDGSAHPRDELGRWVPVTQATRVPRFGYVRPV